MSGGDLDDAIRLGPPADAADALVLLLHGVGSMPDALAPLTRAIARSKPRIAVVALPGTQAFDCGQIGRQWFSVAGINDDNRPGRIAAAMVPLDERIDTELDRVGVGRDRLALVGFSQGAMMALSVGVGPRPPAAVAALAGRLATPVCMTSQRRPTVLVAHGKADPVVPVEFGHQAYNTLRSSGFDVQLHLTARLGHRVAQSQFHIVLGHLAKLASAASGTPADDANQTVLSYEPPDVGAF